MTQPLKFILEAAVLASHQPLSIEQLAKLFDEALCPSHKELAETLEVLSADCEGRGVELVEVASGFRYQIKTDVYPHVAKLWAERQSKYSRALLETLSLIAYRQPITRAEIEAVRGVAVSSNIVRTLEEREWIRVVGHREVPGRPALFGTTRGFLDYFKLKSLEDLPTLSEIKDLNDQEAELDFAPIRSTSGAQDLKFQVLLQENLPKKDVLKKDLLKKDIPKKDLPEQVSPTGDTGKQVSSQQESIQATPTTLREAAVISTTAPDHDSAMPEPSNQI